MGNDSNNCFKMRGLNVKVPKSATIPSYSVTLYNVADSEFESACLIHELSVKTITDNNPPTYVRM